jgi:hypothetical protein
MVNYRIIFLLKIILFKMPLSPIGPSPGEPMLVPSGEKGA